jgi:hypothetical protein
MLIRYAAAALKCEAWNIRMEQYGGSTQPSRTLRAARNSGYRLLRVRSWTLDRPAAKPCRLGRNQITWFRPRGQKYLVVEADVDANPVCKAGPKSLMARPPKLQPFAR